MKFTADYQSTLYNNMETWKIEETPKSPKRESKVLYIANLPKSMTTNLLERVMSAYGQVERSLILRPKNEALLEMKTLHDSRSLFHRAKKNNLVIQGNLIEVSFSKHKSLEMFVNQDPPSTVLLLTVCTTSELELGLWDLINFIQQYADLVRIRLFQHHTLTQCLAQFSSLEESVAAKNQLSTVSMSLNNNIYRFEVQFSKMKNLFISENGPSSYIVNPSFVSNQELLPSRNDTSRYTTYMSSQPIRHSISSPMSSPYSSPYDATLPVRSDSQDYSYNTYSTGHSTPVHSIVPLSPEQQYTPYSDLYTSSTRIPSPSMNTIYSNNSSINSNPIYTPTSSSPHPSESIHSNHVSPQYTNLYSSTTQHYRDYPVEIIDMNNSYSEDAYASITEPFNNNNSNNNYPIQSDYIYKRPLSEMPQEIYLQICGLSYIQDLMPLDQFIYTQQFFKDFKLFIHKGELCLKGYPLISVEQMNYELQYITFQKEHLSFIQLHL
ncbi:hypothetical protein WA158_001300 [Blastocystis sp. Blastoise]